ncbi:hypothetical protein JCM9743_21910 [Natrinema sp. JCM 9743]
MQRTEADDSGTVHVSVDANTNPVRHPLHTRNSTSGHITEKVFYTCCDDKHADQNANAPANEVHDRCQLIRRDEHETTKRAERPANKRVTERPPQVEQGMLANLIRRQMPTLT